jgi:hypothetical protein
MSKAWDLTDVPNDDHEALKGRSQRAFETRRQQLVKEEKKMSADWLHDDDTRAGYHLTNIPRGVYGESSKILEEVQELQDAEAQNARIMALHELSDIIGAVYGYLRKHFPDMKFEDLLTMANVTRRAFESGKRT